jgi:hypothetical protein
MINGSDRDGPDAFLKIAEHLPGSLAVVPTFIGPTGRAGRDFRSVARTAKSPGTLDAVGVASMLAFQYVVDGRTLLAGVRRTPWLVATAAAGGQVGPTALDGYGRRLMTRHGAAEELLRRLRCELERAFGAAERVTLLLSGGLDSRLASAVLVGLAREGKVTDEIRAVSWGIPESRDRHYAGRVARRLGVGWTPIDLGPADLAGNVGLSARGLGAMVSPVHLHAIQAVSELDWQTGDKILGCTLGNGVGRATYLYRHITYTGPIEPADWLGLMRADVRRGAIAGLVQDLAAFRRRLRGRPTVAVHECEMLAHYVSGLLLPVFNLVGETGVPVHQALSDPTTYEFLWSLSPLVRVSSMYRAAVRMSGPGMAEVPYALTNRPLRWLARPEPNGLSPFVHRYPRWIAHELADTVDDALTVDWFDATGVFDGAAIRRLWQGLRQQTRPQPQAAYVLLWLCALRELVEDIEVISGWDRPGLSREGEPGLAPHDGAHQAPPWGFAGRYPDPRWRRWAALPKQGRAALRCLQP